MSNRLSSHCYLATVADDLVILDAKRGFYLCIPASSHCVRRTDADDVEILNLDLLAQLAGAGMVAGADDDGAEGLRRPVQPVGREVLEGPASPLTMDVIADLAAVYVAAVWRFRIRSFGAVVAGARSHEGPRRAKAGDLLEDVRLFQLCLPWLPFQGRCLLRSFLLLAFLRRRGHTGMRWVFGVATWPFAAHCWLQVGDTVLDDHVGRLVRYTPIMAV